MREGGLAPFLADPVSRKQVMAKDSQAFVVTNSVLNEQEVYILANPVLKRDRLAVIDASGRISRMYVVPGRTRTIAGHGVFPCLNQDVPRVIKIKDLNLGPVSELVLESVYPRDRHAVTAGEGEHMEELGAKVLLPAPIFELLSWLETHRGFRYYMLLVWTLPLAYFTYLAGLALVGPAYYLACLVLLIVWYPPVSYLRTEKNHLYRRATKVEYDSVQPS
jgi:hypothetical protein